MTGCAFLCRFVVLVSGIRRMSYRRTFFVQYCFTLTKRGQYELADEILRHLLVSNAYHSREAQDTVRLALISEFLSLIFFSIFDRCVSKPSGSPRNTLVPS